VDPVSQAALGAAWAQPAARSSQKLTATALGAAAGMAADLYTLIRSGGNPLLALEYHRHFTHSLIFIPLGALACALLCYPLFGRRIGFVACYAFAFLGFASHGLLDACTSYGTMLLWPWSLERVAWNLISVVDPLFTVPLIVCLVIGLRRQRTGPVLAGLAWCLVYLGIGLAQNTRAVTSAVALAASRGHAGAEIVAKPSFANLLVWKTYYEFDGRLYIDAVRTGLQSRAIEGESFPQLSLARDFPWLRMDSTQWQDAERFLRFANGFVAVAPEPGNRIVDVRYSLIPNRGDGFWGLELDPEAGADAHAAYVTMRTRTMAEGRELLRMILHGD
jgi:inner membrane protein